MIRAQHTVFIRVHPFSYVLFTETPLVTRAATFWDKSMTFQRGGCYDGDYGLEICPTQGTGVAGMGTTHVMIGRLDSAGSLASQDTTWETEKY